MQKVVCFIHWLKLVSFKWHRISTSRKTTWGPPLTWPQWNWQNSFLKTQPCRACDNGPKHKQHIKNLFKKNLWEFGKKCKKQGYLDQDHSSSPLPAQPGRFVLRWRQPEPRLLPSRLPAGQLFPWEDLSISPLSPATCCCSYSLGKWVRRGGTFFGPDPTNKMDAAQCTENTGVSTAVTLAHISFLFAQTRQSVTYIGVFSVCLIER